MINSRNSYLTGLYWPVPTFPCFATVTTGISIASAAVFPAGQHNAMPPALQKPSQSLERLISWYTATPIECRPKKRQASSAWTWPKSGYVVTSLVR